MTVLVAFEGDTDLPVVRKLARDAGLTVVREIDCGGKHRLDADLPGYNDAAQGSPWFVLRDLDHDAECAPEWLRRCGFSARTWMCLRLAVRELESWLLADAVAMASFLQVDSVRIPTDPDGLADPTRTLVDLARQSRRHAIRRQMVPGPGDHVAVGPLYEAKLIEFGELHWSLSRACGRSPSLRDARAALRRLGHRWRHHVEGR
ncbi:MAG: hypothetical protein HY907_00225 [Deltaproteobacteria bacterium]|nr:hypothetical protein [Deltaproteobacteria bacterium]